MSRFSILFAQFSQQDVKSITYCSGGSLTTAKFIAPKASAEGACILSKLGDSYEVWLVTVVVVCVVTVMV